MKMTENYEIFPKYQEGLGKIDPGDYVCMVVLGENPCFLVIPYWIQST